MTVLSFLGGRRNVSTSLLTGLVENFQTKESGESFQTVSLPMEVFLRCVVEVDSASPQQVVAVLRRDLKSKRLQKLATIFCTYSSSSFAQVVRGPDLSRFESFQDGAVWQPRRPVIRVCFSGFLQ